MSKKPKQPKQDNVKDASGIVGLGRRMTAREHLLLGAALKVVHKILIKASKRSRIHFEPVLEASDNAVEEIGSWRDLLDETWQDTVGSINTRAVTPYYTTRRKRA